MFISQVLFECDNEYEENLKAIMRNKITSLNDAQGLLATECWRKEDKNSVGYSLINKWENKECFKTWIAQSHASERQGSKGNNERPPIRKTAYQYEIVETLD